MFLYSYEHVGEVVVEVKKHKSCQCGCKIKANVNIHFCLFQPYLPSIPTSINQYAFQDIVDR